jgi:addiction module HigA family antidote
MRSALTTRTTIEDGKGEFPREGCPAWPPDHPGADLREDILPALGVPVTKAAEMMGVSRQTLHAILAERQSVTPEMALRIGKFCGNGPGFWLRLQMQHDLWNAEREMADEIARIPTLKVA